MLKILHGMKEVAGQGYYSVKGLKELGVDARLAVWQANEFGYKADYDLEIGFSKYKYLYFLLKRIAFFLKALITYNCFHFHAARSFLPGNLDLWIIKLFNKKVFFEFHGSELRGVIRHIPYEYFTTKLSTKRKKNLLIKLVKYADGFIIHDEELRPHLPESDVPVYVVPLRMDISQFRADSSSSSNEIPNILHAPSRRSTKGTKYILNVQQKTKFPCNLVLVEGKTQAEALKLYEKADIIFDQISVGTYGVFAIEAMALGKPVLAYISPEMIEKLPENLPLVNVNPNNIIEKIDLLLSDSKLRYSIGENSRKYVEEYHDYLTNAKLLKAIYEYEGEE